MIVNMDLLGIPCAAYCKHNGVKGIYIPEVPNFRYFPGEPSMRRGKPARAILRFGPLKTMNRKQKYDFMGRMHIWPEFLDAYMSNPNTVNRKRFMVYGYNFSPGKDESPAPESNAEDFAALLDD